MSADIATGKVRCRLNVTFCTSLHTAASRAHARPKTHFSAQNALITAVLLFVLANRRSKSRKYIILSSLQRLCVVMKGKVNLHLI